MVLRLTLACSLASLVACSSVHERPYQTVALTRGLIHDGFLIGVEKRSRKAIDYPETGHDPERLQLAPGDPIADPKGRRAHIFRRVHADRRMLVVSHCYEMGSLPDGSIRSLTIYNGYDGGLITPPDGVFDDEQLSHADGYAALNRLAAPLKRMLVDKRATHLFYMCMGWHNDQVECLARYNAILRNLKRTAVGEFRPVSVCLTWPSAWLAGSPAAPIEWAGHVTSYPTKADDADELGFGIGNHLLHRVILPLKKVDALSDLKVIMIGHSLGARAMSRALLSEPYLVPCSTPRGEVDLFFGLQGAFPAHRYVAGKGHSGAPYAGAVSHPARTVLTASCCDSANEVIRWLNGSRYVGGKYGLTDAHKHPDVFDVVTWPRASGPYPQVDLRKVVMVDATAIVKPGSPGTGTKPVSAHNDILDDEMALLLWHYMRALP